MSDKGQVLLTEEFKAKVFAALKAGEPRQAQQLCFELANENEAHAKQIYGHLLKTARKRGWVKKGKTGKSASTSGLRKAHSGIEVLPDNDNDDEIVEVTPVHVVAVDVTALEVAPLDVAPAGGALPVPQGLLGDPGGALPVPQGLLGDPGGALPVPQGLLGDPGGALPVPQGLLGDSGAQPGYAPPPAPYADPNAGYPPPAPYADPNAGYPPPAPYADPNAGYPPPAPYADPNAGYPPPAAYADPNAGYPPPAAYADPNAGYPPPAAYADPNAGYPPPAPYADPNAGYPPPAAYADPNAGYPPPAPYADPNAGYPPPAAYAPPGPGAPPAGHPRSDSTQSAGGFSPPGGYPLPDSDPKKPGAFSPVGGYPIPAGVSIPQRGDDPPERGFLARVGAEGRAARVRLLLQAGQTPSARALAESTRTHAPFSAHAHAAVGAVLLSEGEPQQALAAYTQAVRADPQDRLAVRGYASALRALGRPREAAEALKRIVSPTEGTLTDLYALDASLRQAGDEAAADRVRKVASSREVAGLESLHQTVQQQVAAGNSAGAAQALLELFEQLEPPYRSAVDLATKLMQRGPDTPLTSACAEVYLRADKPWLAVRALHRTSAHTLDAPGPRRLLGRAYLALGAGPLAEEQLMFAAQAGVATAEDFLALGEVYLDQGEAEASARAFGQALEADAQGAQVHHRLANALALAGDLDGAVRALENAQQLAGEEQAEDGTQDALDRITERANDGRIRSALAHLSVNGDDLAAHMDLAEALAGRGDTEEALRHFRLAAGSAEHRERVRDLCQRLIQPGEDRELALFLGQLLVEDGEARAAVQALEGSADAALYDVELQVAYCRALGMAKRWQAACDRLAEVLPQAGKLELEPALRCAGELLERDLDRGLVFACAHGLQRLARYADAEAWLKRYAVEHVDDLEVAGFRADLFEAQGDFEGALRVFQPLAERPSAPVRLIERAGLLALAAGQANAARDLLRRAHELAPSDPVAHAAYERAQSLWRSQEIARLAKSAASRNAVAALHAASAQHTQALAALGPALGTPPERGYYSFACEHLADQPEVAESVIRWVAQRTNMARGSAGYHEALYRTAQLYEARSDMENARRLYLETHLGDSTFRDVASRLDALSQSGRAHPSSLSSGRLPEGAPRSVFEVLRDLNLDLS